MQAMCQLQSRHDRFETERRADRESALAATGYEQFLESKRKLPGPEVLRAVCFFSTAVVASITSCAWVVRATTDDAK
jgi:hypothetical protein